jgi:hypothetical protein
VVPSGARRGCFQAALDIRVAHQAMDRFGTEVLRLAHRHEIRGRGRARCKMCKILLSVVQGALRRALDVILVMAGATLVPSSGTSGPGRARVPGNTMLT